MRQLLVLLLCIGFGMGTAYAADTQYTVTLTRKQQAALEYDRAIAIDGLTQAQRVQQIVDNALAGFLSRYVQTAKNEGVTLAAGAILPIPVVTGTIDVYEVGGARNCNFTLTNGSSPIKNVDTDNKCSVTKDTATKLNVYWNAAKDRYEIQSTFAVPVTITLIRIE